VTVYAGVLMLHKKLKTVNRFDPNDRAFSGGRPRRIEAVARSKVKARQPNRLRLLSAPLQPI
jgi:hypothetical protein